MGAYGNLEEPMGAYGNLEEPMEAYGSLRRLLHSLPPKPCT